MSSASATHLEVPFVKSHSRSDIQLTHDYPQAPRKVWRALTEPALMAQWGMHPQGFAPVVGKRFLLIGKPNLAWRGFIECQVLQARAPSALRYSFVARDNQAATELSYSLIPHAGGTRLVLEHTGWKGPGGFLVAKLIMTPGLKDMLAQRLPSVLAELDAG